MTRLEREREATLAEVWALMSTPLMRIVGEREQPLPELERVDVSIRPLNPNVWGNLSEDER